MRRVFPVRGLYPALLLSLGLASSAPVVTAAALAVAAETPLALQAGEVRVLGIPGVARVAVGDGKILNAVSTDDREVIVFARKPGFSTLHAWTADGQAYRYAVEVAPEGARQLQDELRSLLERIPGVRVTPLGDKLLVEGDELSDSDRQRLAELGRRYPQLLDFTGTVGWDRMVLLDVRVVEVPRSLLREVGLRWGSNATGGVNAGLGWDGGSRRYADRPGETVLPLAFPSPQAAGYFGVNALLSARIDLLAQDGRAVVLAQPQLLARSGATAEFLAGGEVPYSTVDGNGNTQTAFKPYGVSLRITPSIERSGAVRSRLEVEVSAIDPSLSVPGGPSLKTRRTATEFNVRSGQTLVLAGFLSRDAARNVDRLPGLGDLPILGALFRSTRFQRNETELAILVTPQLVTADHPDLRQRVRRADAILDRAFPASPMLMAPIRPVRGSTAMGFRSGWNPRASGPGSQWQGGAVEPAHASGESP
ncbi:type II and III secretion system protein family protein [Castellaniella denitrificans]|mgnify:CR=1 FL=1|uniref:Type IV pilus biogenesis and competence protein PilQ n=1 Tax=Castellaniella denitrificans TaxID=56119 RepID=A0ABT4M790_9BURK|nr:pilus assembly protein N-terminal domain-containing protein [Castellaniella denitrificans]MCZ4330959.1 pilus assembly protein N-terminal domain-containing protein [Castellaniella denitrificans]